MVSALRQARLVRAMVQYPSLASGEGILADVAYESLGYCKELAKRNGPLAGIFQVRPSYFVATDEAEEGALDALAVKLQTLGNKVKVVADLPNHKAVALGFGSEVRRLLKLDGEGQTLRTEGATICEAASATLATAVVEANWRAWRCVAVAGMAAVTKAVVANCVVSVPGEAVGAAGTPVKVGLAMSALFAALAIVK